MVPNIRVCIVARQSRDEIFGYFSSLEFFIIRQTQRFIEGKRKCQNLAIIIGKSCAMPCRNLRQNKIICAKINLRV